MPRGAASCSILRARPQRGRFIVAQGNALGTRIVPERALKGHLNRSKADPPQALLGNATKKWAFY